MKKSIRWQIAGIFIGLVIVIMLLSTLLNSQLLEKFYVYNKQEKLIHIYEEIEEAVEMTRGSYEGMAERLSGVTEAGNATFIIVSTNNQQLLSSTTNQWRTEQMRSQLVGYLLEVNPDEGKILKARANYQILSAKDVVSGDEYIEMYGSLDDGSRFLIRSPLESIRESVVLANRFLLYVTIGLAVIASVCVWYFARKISNPILELATLSQRMADLDFDAKYNSGGKNEIGVLGENFNAMSTKLEQTISELKNANYELQKDIERREQIEAMRSEFVGNVSHELKTPIALIQGYAEGLKEGVSDNPESKAFYCDVIMDEASKMNELVKNLMTLNQLEAGQEEVCFERFDIMELIRGVLLSCEILIQQKQADVRVNRTEPVYVWADEWRTEQVFRNYLSNALNHLEGEKVIDICANVSESMDNVRISVFNTGKQIPESEFANIWNKFYKVDKARTREYGGNGIGLSIVKAIMESIHKEYGVKNYNNGVEFWFELDTK